MIARKLLIIVTVLAAIATSCGDDDAESTTTAAPSTAAPTTAAPTTMAPTTMAPTTMAPTTMAPTTMAPTTQAPDPMQALVDAALEEGELVWYAALSTEDARKIADAFEAAYPGISVEIVSNETAATAERILSEYRTDQENADVFMSSGQYSLQLAEAGAMLPYPDSPAQAAVPAGIRDPNGEYFAFIQITNTIAYNTDLVSEADAPKSWQDLLDPKWKGKITMQAPRGGGAFSWFVWMRDNAFGGDVEQWTQFMRNLVAQDLLLGDYFQAQDFLSSGEASVHAVAYPSFVEALKEDGAPVEWVAVSPMPTNPQHLAIYAKAPHPNAAKLFIDWMLSREGQTFLSAEMKNTVVRGDVDDPAGAKLAGVEFIAKDTIDIAEHQDEYLELAREIFDLP